MEQAKIVLIILLGLSGLKTYAYEFSAKNDDGITIYYNYTNNGLELEVTYCDESKGKYEGIIVIPDEVTYMNRTRKVTSIGKNAFSKNGQGITSITIPQCVTNIGDYAFANCRNLASITLPSKLETIGMSAFKSCEFSSIDLPSNVTSIGSSAFYNCMNLTSIVIPSSVKSIGFNAFERVNLEKVVSLINNPFPIADINLSDDFGEYRTFSQNTFNNATLYVPIGTIDKYKATKGWQDFLFIEEGDGENASSEKQQCAKPTINYENGKLYFSCETEGVEYKYTIEAADAKEGYGNGIKITNTYKVSVYAFKDGWNNSETAITEITAAEGDLNGDGVINAADVVKLTDLIIKQ